MLRTAEPVAVVGAGLIGSLFSLELGKRGKDVTLFERRPDMRREAISAGRSINLAVSARGIHALDRVGLKEKVLEQAVPMRGRMIHSLSGGQTTLTFQPYGKDDSECIYSISRGDLNKTLMTAAEATGKVTIRFNERIEAADLATGKLALKSERDGTSSDFTAGTIFGTDGSAGSIRREILAKAPGAKGTDTYLDYGYKELLITPKAGGSGRDAFKMEPNALHIWPRGTYMLIALPNHEGSYTVTLFLPMEGPYPSFETLSTPEKVTRFFTEQFPDALPVLEDLEGTFFSNPTGRMVTLHTEPWSFGDRALLLGDAAHAIVPFFGQGMNCGFEDVTEFFEQFDGLEPSQAGRIEIFFDRYWRARKPDSDAIARMAVENFVEMRDKVADPKFLLEKEVEKILQKEFPGEYISRYGLVTFHRVPYRVALEAGLIQDGILSELCSGAGLRQAKDVDMARASSLIRERLGGVWKQWGLDRYR